MQTSYRNSLNEIYLGFTNKPKLLWVKTWKFLFSGGNVVQVVLIKVIVSNSINLNKCH